jgi:hypothetical protein
MRLATIKGERELSDLVARLYHLESPEARALAEEALLKANPHLADLRTLREGTPLLVPHVPGVRAVPEGGPLAAGALDLAEQLRRALDQTRTALDAAGDAAVREAKVAVELLKSREVKALAEKFPEVKDRLGSAAEEAKARQRDAEQSAKLRKQVFTRLRKQLDALAKRLS